MKEKHKCNFCEVDAVRVYNILLGFPVDNILQWEYHGEKIYACDNHRLHLSACNLDGSDICEFDV
jgi:hypothetical protein